MNFLLQSTWTPKEMFVRILASSISIYCLFISSVEHFTNSFYKLKINILLRFLEDTAYNPQNTQVSTYATQVSNFLRDVIAETTYHRIRYVLILY